MNEFNVRPESTVAVTPGKDLAATASAALAKATIEAKFTVALHRKRSVLGARATILDACRRPRFAEAALFAKPVGRGQVVGFSIRFAEEAINAWGNVDVTSVTAWEDDLQRLVRITVTDLETNTSYGDEVLLAKTVERSSVKDGQEILGERLNSYGKRVYIVRATEDELTNKLNAAKSKSIRNSGLRLIPADIKEEAMELINSTASLGGGDPAADGKRLADAFGKIGVSVQNLEAYLGHPLAKVSPAELADLRLVFAAIRDGEATWSDYARVKDKDDDDVPMGTAKKESPQQAKEPEAKAGTSTEASAGATTQAQAAEPEASAGGPVLSAAQNRMSDWLKTDVITWDDFTGWLVTTGRAAQAKDWGSVAEMPDAVIETLWASSDTDAGYKANLGKCVQLYGRKDKK